MNRQLTNILLLLALLCASCRAQQVHYNANFDVSASNFADSVNIDWKDLQVYVPVRIGDRDYRFLLDTGAGQTIVYDDSPFRRQCTEAGFMLAHDANGLTDTVRVVRMPAMTIGSVTFTGCQANVQRRALSGQSFDGILGFDLVCHGLSMKIDVRQRRLVLTDRRDFFKDEPGFDVKYRLDYHVPYVTVGPFGNYTESARFDTGSRQFYSINKQSFDRGEMKCRPQVSLQVEGRSVGRHAIGHYGAEQRGEVVFLSLDRLRLGGYAFTDVHTVSTQGGSHLGAAVLEQGTVAFDPRHKHLRFAPYDGGTEGYVGNRQLEIAFVAEQGLPVVGLVWEQGEPYRCGFREGDTVVAIDDRPVVSAAQFRGWGFERGRSYRFTLRSPDGRLRTVSWVRLPQE